MPERVVQVEVDLEAFAKVVDEWAQGADHTPTVLQVPLILNGNRAGAAGVLVWRNRDMLWAALVGKGVYNMGHWEA